MMMLHQTENISKEKLGKKKKGGNYRVKKYNKILTRGAQE